MDFKKLFSVALKYPLSPYPFLILLVVNLFFSFLGFQLISPDLLGMPDTTRFLLNFIPIAAANIIIAVLLMAMYVDNAAHYFHAGKRVPLRKSIPVAKKRFFRLLGAFVVMAILIGIPFLLLLAGPVGAIAGFIVAMIVAYYVLLAPYAVILMNSSAIASIKASYGIVNKNKLRWLVFFLVFAAISVVISFISAISLLYNVSLLSPVSITWQAIVITYSTLFTYSAFANFYLGVKKARK